MRRDILAIVGLVLILSVIVGAGMISSPFLIHGYDTPIARITEVDHSYQPEANIGPYENIENTHAEIYPFSVDAADWMYETGLRIEISSAVKILDTPKEYIETIVEVVEDHEAKTNMTKNWDVHKVKCSIGATIWTYEGGTAKCGEATFWVTLSANPSSIFMDLDEHYDFFVNVYNIDPVSIVGEMEVTPTATVEYEYTAVETDKIPQWIIDSGYTGELNNHRSIKFPIKVLNAQPTLVAEVIRTGEASATFNIGIDVILIGYWEQEVDYRKHRIPELPDLLADLIAFLTLFFWVALGFIATILVFRFVPDWKMKLLATGIVWAVLLIIYGFEAIRVWTGG